jgi:hypothetical protein
MAYAGNVGNGLCYRMAGLKATMAMPGSTASCFAECAQASQATAEGVATEHTAVCCLIVDNQAGALRWALGPEVTERTYMAVLNAKGVFLVMHGLQQWAEAPGGARNHRGQMVAFKGEVRTGTGIPNLWRFEEPDDQLFRLLTLLPILLSNTALYYEDEKRTNTILPRLPQMPGGADGHQYVGDSSRSWWSGCQCFWIIQTQVQRFAGWSISSTWLTEPSKTSIPTWPRALPMHASPPPRRSTW